MTDSSPIRFTVTSAHAGERLDRFLTEKFSDLSRSQIQRLVKEKWVQVDGHLSKPAQILKAGQDLEVRLPQLRPAETAAEAIPLDILYEDDDLIAINKAAEMVVHPGSGISSGTMVNALIHHCGELSGVGGVARPGIVHRLDKGTSGVLLVAKNDKAHHGLSAQFEGRSVEKIYHAFVWGEPRDLNGVIESVLGRSAGDRKKISSRTAKGRKAVTHYTVLKSWGYVSLLELKPLTGRTHQLRVHLAELGHPVVGDPTYGKGLRRFDALPTRLQAWVRQRPFQLLHAQRISFDHPRSQRRLSLDAPLREEMREFQVLLNRELGREGK